MRAIHKGSIAWGLVNVPVRFFSATEDHDLHAHQVHAADNGRIRYRRVCEACDETVESRDIVKSYDTNEGQKILTEDDLATLHEGDNREVEVMEFVDGGEIDPLAYDKSYFIEPDGSLKAYTLLAKTLASTDRVAIVRFTMRQRTHLAALRVVGKSDTLAIQTLRWADEIREPDFPTIKPVEVSDAELKMAGQLVESMVSETWNPDKYRDSYRDELIELLASKTPADASGVEPGAEEVSDLLAKLDASVTAKMPKRRVRKMVDRPVRKRVKVMS